MLFVRLNKSDRRNGKVKVKTRTLENQRDAAPKIDLTR